MTLSQSSPMRLVIQRVANASVEVDGQVVGAIGAGLLVLVAAEPTDDKSDVERAVDKLSTIRLFADEIGKMNLDIGQAEGSILVVSQFTLLADLRRGRRPSFAAAGDPAHANAIVDDLVAGLRDVGIRTETGVFGAKMSVSLVNDGPVTMIVDIKDGQIV